MPGATLPATHIILQCLRGPRLNLALFDRHLFPTRHHPRESLKRLGPVDPSSAHLHLSPMSTSNHSFIPPSAGDSRSPCPALNALANHSILCVCALLGIASFGTDVHSTDPTMGAASPPCNLSVPSESITISPCL